MTGYAFNTVRRMYLHGCRFLAMLHHTMKQPDYLVTVATRWHWQKVAVRLLTVTSSSTAPRERSERCFWRLISHFPCSLVPSMTCLHRRAPKAPWGQTVWSYAAAPSLPQKFMVVSLTPEVLEVSLTLF